MNETILTSITTNDKGYGITLLNNNRPYTFDLPSNPRNEKLVYDCYKSNDYEPILELLKNSEKKDKQFVNVKEVSEILGISVQQVLRLTREGRIPSFNVGMGTQRIHPRYDVKVIESLLKGKNEDENQEGIGEFASKERNLLSCNLPKRKMEMENNTNKRQKFSTREGKRDNSKTPITERVAGEIYELIGGNSKRGSEGRN